jgi:hypothetical protein
MAKEKVTLTLDAATLAALRRLVGPRSLSAAVDRALAAHVQKLKHFSAVDQWLEELEATHGPTTPESIEWAAKVFDDWQRAKQRSKAG